jgi:hypothetical protein
MERKLKTLSSVQPAKKRSIIEGAGKILQVAAATLQTQETIPSSAGL